MPGLARWSTSSKVTSLLLALVALAGLAFGATGGRLYVVSTPSMGTAAPVGTLLLTRHVELADVRLGDVITFHNPLGEVYSHRVVARTAHGLRTRGDINAAPDAWTIGQHRLVGRVVARVPAGGPVLRGLPLVILLSGVLWLGGMVLRPAGEDVLRLLRVPLAVAATVVVLHPWVALEQTGTTSDTRSASISAVSTGLMPVRMTAVGASGTSGRLAAGEVGTVRVPLPHHASRVHVQARPDLDLLWWVVVVLLCLAPMALSVLIGLPPRPERA